MEWTVGQKIHHDKYAIEKVLGRGGFGITYKAIHTGLNNPVVIKVPFERFASYFDVEIQILAALSNQLHPHIVRVRDQFYEDQIPCLVMDFVEGDNLFDFLQQRQSALLEVEAVRLISQIGEALAFMHELGLVHRDVNPKNIICQRDGRAVLIDFGTARRIAANSDETSSINVPIRVKLKTLDQQPNQYTRAFAPYEQISGKSDCLPTVDIYSLAATLYYLVTKKYPELAEDQRIYNRQLEEPKRYAEISSRLNQAILDGMKLNAEDRPQSMREWLNLLTRGSTMEPDYSPSLSLELDTNYPLLEDFLSKKEWAKADQQTSHLILKIADREAQGWLDTAAWQEFPCSELQKIDSLWLRYSQEYLGFNIQRNIWKRVEGDWAQFSANVGWHSFKERHSFKHSFMQMLRNLFGEQEQFQAGQFPTIAKPPAGILLGRHPDERIHEQLTIDLQENLILLRQKTEKERANLSRLRRQQSQAQSEADQWKQRSEITQSRGDDALSQEALDRMNQYLNSASNLEYAIREQSEVFTSYKAKLLNLQSKVDRLKSVRKLAIELLVSKLDRCDEI